MVHGPLAGESATPVSESSVARNLLNCSQNSLVAPSLWPTPSIKTNRLCLAGDASNNSLAPFKGAI